MNRRRLYLPTAVLSLLVLAAPPAAAQYTWTGAGGGIPPYYSPISWLNPYNWQGVAVPVSSQSTTITFGAAPVITSQDAGNPFLLNQMVFSSSAGPYILSGAPIELHTVSLITHPPLVAAIIQNSPNSIQIANNLILYDSGFVVYGSGTGAVTIAGNVSGPGTLNVGSLVFNFPSSLVILSGAGNTYSGGTGVSFGTLQLGAGTAIPTGTNVSINAGNASNANAVFDIGTLSNSSSTAIGTLTLGAQAHFQIGSGSTGDYHLSTLALAGGAVTDNGLSTSFFLHLHSANAITTTASTFVATIDLAGNSRIQNDAGVPANITVASGTTSNGIDLDISAIMSAAGTNSNFVKSGPGQLRLSNPSNTASFTISQGTLRVDDMTNLGYGDITLNGGTLLYNGFNQASPKPMFLQSLSTINVAVSGVTLTLAAALSGTTGLNKIGPGTLELSNAATSIAGPVTISGGTLRSAGQLGDLTLQSGTFVVTGPGVTVDSLTGVASSTVDVATFGLDISGNSITTFAGSIVGNGGLIKAGAAAAPGSSLTLVGVNSFTGPLTVGNIHSGGTVALGVTNALFPTTAIQLTNGSLSLVVGGVSFNQSVGSLAGGATSAVALGSAVLTVGNDNTSTTFAGSIGGAGGSLVKVGSGTLSLTGASTYSGGTTIARGVLTVSSDAALGAASGPVSIGPLGTLTYTGTSTTGRTFTLNSGAFSVAAGQTLTMNGATVGGGFMRGTGTFAVTGGTVLSGATTANSTTVNVTGSGSFVDFSDSGAMTVTAAPVTPVNFDLFINQGSGAITIGAGSQVKADDFQSYGTLTFTNGAAAAKTLFTNIGTTPLSFNGGSRTFIGTVGGNAATAGIELNGQNAIVAGGLFVNNGQVTDNSFLGISTIISDYGALVKGGGQYDNSPITRNGGKFQSGNSPGVATMGRFVFGPGGVSNYVFAIDDATGQAGPTPDALGHVSGWGLVKAAIWQRSAGPTSGDFTFTADPSHPLTFAIETLVNPTTAGTDIPGLMADFDPSRSYSWPAVQWTGAYSGPTDAAALDAATNFDTSGLANPITGSFGWSLDPAANALSLTYTPSAVPEPGALALVGLAAAGLAWQRRRVTTSSIN